MLERTLIIPGPFSLEQALRFLKGFPPAGTISSDATYRAAHVLDERAYLVTLTASPTEALILGLEGPDLSDSLLDAAERLVRRVFSLDLDGYAFYERVGRADPVLGSLQQRFAGLRPVLFGSPFEALCWTIICQRVGLAQGARLKARFAEAFGPTITVGDEAFRAFPSPENLRALDPVHDARQLGLPETKLQRLQALAERGRRGDFEPGFLLGLGADAARAWLEQRPGIGPWASEFTLIRGVGYPDLLPRNERRLLTAVQRFYGLDHEPTFAEVAARSEAWAGFRSWAAFLLRVALQTEMGLGEDDAPVGEAMGAPLLRPRSSELPHTGNA